MCGESVKGRSGKTYHYYKCVSVKKKRTDCKKKAIKKDFIEEFVVRHTMKMLADDKAIEAIVAMLMDLQERENINLPLYEQQLRDVERNIENLLDAIQQGIFTKSTKGRLDELESAKEDLEIRIANEKIAKPKLTEDKIKHFLYRFRALDMRKEKHRQLLIDMFVNRIYLYDDKLVITFNHKDGAETITLEEVETALAEAGFGSDLVSLAVPGWIRKYPAFFFFQFGTRRSQMRPSGGRLLDAGSTASTPLFSLAAARENANESLSAYRNGYLRVSVFLFRPLTRLPREGFAFFMKLCYDMG